MEDPCLNRTLLNPESKKCRSYLPVTPGQFSFLLGIVPVFAAWIYAEYLEYKKKNTLAKAHSDREEEGSSLPSPKARTSTSTFPIFRFFIMEEQFLIDNRLTLRAISEFGFFMAYFYICDRTDILGSSKKSYNRDLFLFLYFLLIIVSAVTSFTIHHDKSPFSGKPILYLNRHQTEEWKGWMQISALLGLHR
ncbi:hypothetical protein OIU79_004662 [Salix purpurea]|uniref:Cas1p 10 TM acyl transferase domain-containing protein n=1 Tax=Salix purpurea TaxID=77065 RepID=A0A9Q0UAW6_SALPP|nr:hypothetical protein OIU79_004662 [Salix purpurea]